MAYRHKWSPIRVTFKTAVLVWKCLHDVAPRYLVDLCVPSTAATAGRRQSRSAVSIWGSHGTLDQDIDRPTQLRCLRPQNLEPTTASPSTTTARTVAIFIQAPAQDPPCPLPAPAVLVVAVSLVYTALRCCCDCSEFGADYKCPDSTQTFSKCLQVPCIGYKDR